MIFLYIVIGLIVFAVGYCVFLEIISTKRMNKDPLFQSMQNYHNASRNELARHLNQEAVKMNSSSN